MHYRMQHGTEIGCSSPSQAPKLLCVCMCVCARARART